MVKLHFPGSWWLPALVAALTLGHLPAPLAAQEAPRVLKVVPANGSDKVDPALTEVLITFSEAMDRTGFSLVIDKDEAHFPKVAGRYGFRADGRTFFLKVSLKPEWDYRFWVNSRNRLGFKSLKGVPARPLLVTFRTGPGKGGRQATTPRAEPAGERVEFALEDCNGVRLTSQDYQGVPLFITFGAAW